MASESATGVLIACKDLSGDTLKLSFDYRLGDEEEDLNVHLWGYVNDKAELSPLTFTMNTGAKKGNAWESSNASGIDYLSQYNLLNKGEWREFPGMKVTRGAAQGSVELTGVTGWHGFDRTISVKALSV